MNSELQKPDEYDALCGVIKNMCAVEWDADDARALQKRRVASVDVHVISRYIENYLCDQEYKTRSSPEALKVLYSKESFTDRGAWVIHSQKQSISDAINEEELKKTFSKISEAVLQYFKDLETVKGTFNRDDFCNGLDHNTSVGLSVTIMREEAEKGFFSRELLPFMLAGMSQQQRDAEKDNSFFEAAFKNAKSNNAFSEEVDDAGHCPFSRRLASILALKPHRDPETGKVTIIGKEPGALPAFIHNEIENGIGASAQPTIEEEAALT